MIWSQHDKFISLTSLWFRQSHKWHIINTYNISVIKYCYSIKKRSHRRHLNQIKTVVAIYIHAKLQTGGFLNYLQRKQLNIYAPPLLSNYCLSNALVCWEEQCGRCNQKSPLDCQCGVLHHPSMLFVTGRFLSFVHLQICIHQLRFLLRCEVHCCVDYATHFLDKENCVKAPCVEEVWSLIMSPWQHDNESGRFMFPVLHLPRPLVLVTHTEFLHVCLQYQDKKHHIGWPFSKRNYLLLSQLAPCNHQFQENAYPTVFVLPCFCGKKQQFLKWWKSSL